MGALLLLHVLQCRQCKLIATLPAKSTHAACAGRPDVACCTPLLRGRAATQPQTTLQLCRRHPNAQLLLLLLLLSRRYTKARGSKGWGIMLLAVGPWASAASHGCDPHSPCCCC